MLRLKPNKVTTKAEPLTEEIKGMLGLTFQTNLSSAQRNAGIEGKVVLNHPAFTTRCTIYKGRVQPSSKKLNSGRWFNIVTLSTSVRNYMLEEFEKYQRGESTPWYLNAVGKERKVIVTNEQSNDTLNIQDIVVQSDLSDSQRNAGILCKVSIRTSIGTIRGITVFVSKYGNSLYLVEQTEDEEDEIPAYRLTDEAKAQVLAYVHSLVDWDSAEDEVANTATDEEDFEELIRNAVSEETVNTVASEKEMFK